jgi:predicted nucleic acid-binding protein
MNDYFDELDVVEAVFFVVTRHRHRGERAARSAAEHDAKWILPELVTEGYVRRTGDGGEYKITEKGKELARAKFIKRIPRSNAVEQLRAFLDRVDIVNAGQYANIVREVWLYGSLITDATDVGDVDLICLLEHRRGHCGFRTYVDHSIARAKDSGRVLNYIGKLKYGSTEVMNFLQDRRVYLSINAFDPAQLEEIKGGYLQIVKDGVVLKDAITKHVVQKANVSGSTAERYA